ncbi:antitoxin [Caulobacter sp. LARHSG274]
MIRTAPFRVHGAQAVRLPKDVAFPEGVWSVTVLRDGKRRMIVPSDTVWDDFFEAPGLDLVDRDQLATQGRQGFQSFTTP